MTGGALPVLDVVVAIPVRDEEALLGRCLQSVVVAADELARVRGLHARVVVVLDSCRDGSEAVARTFPVDVRSIDARSVGAARALAVARGLAGSSVARDRTWIACTDADSKVPAHWLTSQVDLADEGADVVVGTVRPDPADLSADQLRAWSATREPGRPNGHVHGANLGVRADAYERVGGFGLQPEHEDVDLVARIRACGDACVVASDDADVLTSGRPVGRTPGGYARYVRTTLLRSLDA